MKNDTYCINLKSWFLFILFFAILLIITGCGGEGNKYIYNINIDDFNILYNGSVSFEESQVLKNDNDDIIALYQESGNGSGYKDSLLVAKKYSMGLGINAFAQNNLDTLQDNGLTLLGIKKTQLGLIKNNETINAVLVEYKIVEGLLPEIPLLYVSQLFIESDNDIVLFSFITENESSQKGMTRALKNIK